MTTDSVTKQMDMPVKRRTAWICYVMGTCLCLTMAGCKESPKEKPVNDAGTTSQASREMSGAEIIDQLHQEYLAASSYADQASLELSYRLQGRYMDEPHQWSVVFGRDQGVKVDVYDARIRADRDRLGCFIYDFGSGNLDNQWQVHTFNDTLPVRKLFQDGIARHYLSGQAELPVNTSRPETAEAFFPITIGLLTGQGLPEWFERGTAERQPDETFDGRVCFRIAVRHNQLTYDLLVDAENFLLRRLTYPLQLLDERLQGNPDVSGLSLIANFANARFEAEFSPEDFALSIPDDARMVRHFVAVPEPFPSSEVGKQAADLQLRDAATQLISQSDWDGKVTLLVWTSDSFFTSELSETIDRVVQASPGREYNIARVEVIEGALPGNPQVIERLTGIGQQSTTTVLADFGFAAGRALGLESFPIIAILDREGILQYVRNMLDDPLDAEEILAVMLRVRSGDDVAVEMRRDYESFLDLYQERLAEALIDSRPARDDGNLADAAAPTHVSVTRLWHNQDLWQPGNILHDLGRIIVLDGWRTMAELDASGRLVRREVLELESQESISVVRSNGRQPARRLVFSVMGRSARVLDEGFRMIRVANAGRSQQRIRDARLFDIDGDDEDELIVSYTGDRGTEISELADNSPPRQMTEQSLRSLAMVRGENNLNQLITADPSGLLNRWHERADQSSVIENDLVAATQIVVRPDARDTSAICVIGTDRLGQWMAIGLDQSLRQKWSVAIGSQRFDTQIESVAFARLPGTSAGMWAIAASDGSIRLIGDDGKLVDTWATGVPIHGIELIARDHDYLLLFSTDKQVQAWTMSPAAARVFSTSGGPG